MIEARRRAYLEALGFDVWVARQPAVQHGRMGVNAGRGSALLVCPTRADCGTAIALDVTRALGGDPVLAWLDPATDADSRRLEEIIADRLITQILVLGAAAARRLFGREVPGIIGSATVSVAPSLQEIGAAGSARKELWCRLKNLRTPVQAGGPG